MRSTFTCSLALVSALSLAACAAADESPATLLGFTNPHAADQLALETNFDAQLAPADQRAWLEQMTAAPNHVGSPHDRANADFMLARFKE